MFIVLKPIK